MLQSVPSALKQAFKGSFVKKICNYLHDCVREEVKSSTFRNLKGDKENKWFFLDGEEQVFEKFDTPLLLDGANFTLAELMIQSEMNQKDKYLIYGYLFLVGKNKNSKKNNEFLTPLLYAPAKLTRQGTYIQLNIQEDVLSLNMGAVAQLIQREDEQEIDAVLSGLLDVVPELPLTQENLNIFLTTLKSLLPNVEFSLSNSAIDKKQEDNFYNNEGTFDDIADGIFDFSMVNETGNQTKIKPETLSLEKIQAVILTTRPSVTAGVLHELTQIADKPSGTIRETVLNVINQEFLESMGQSEINPKDKNLTSFFPITPLSLSDSQESVIRNIEENDFLSVYGPPGTGKSQTIVNVAAHLIAMGKSVLVASRMDKAVDVVSDRLNELNAPYLALRAGRSNYQRQLNMELQELLSNKINLNSNQSDDTAADIDDMKDLLKDIKRLENSALSILSLEKKYTSIYDEYEMSKDTISDLTLITEKLEFQQLNDAKKIFSIIEEIESKYNKSFFDKIKLFFDYRKIKKLLKLNKVLNEEILKRLPYELNIVMEKAKLEQIEDEINSKGNLHQILRRIKLLKSKQKRLAVDILKNKRRIALKNILSDAQKRRRLMIHSKSLVSRKTNLQNRLLEKEDFKPLLSAFPCWCVTTYAISNSLPLKPAMFDVAIIDEASQCDIASCIPVLYRCKKAIIVGDDKQLPHLSFLEKAKEQSFLSQYGIDDKYQLMWRFRDNSMFDLANYYSMTPVLLDEHFRSPKPIIEFSNNEFYAGKIKVMSSDIKEENSVELRIVKDGYVDKDATRNIPECEEVIKTIQEIIISVKNQENHPTIGVISPFRAQVDLIKKALLKVFDIETIMKYKLDCGTAHTFQGDERDIMLLSWAYAKNSYPQSLMFAQKPNLFNVAITRARHKLINFISKDINELPEGLLRNYLEYVKKASVKKHKNTFKNDFEKVVYNAMREEFLTIKDNIYSNVEMGSMFADIVIDDENNKIAVEIDGVEDNVQSTYNDMKKQAIIERCGYQVIRITKREWNISKNACLDRIRSLLK